VAAGASRCLQRRTPFASRGQHLEITATRTRRVGAVGVHTTVTLHSPLNLNSQKPTPKA